MKKYNLNTSRRLFLKTGILSCSGLIMASSLTKAAISIHNFQKEKFTPDWESLKKYKCPNWFRDAKFGIFLHWGVNSVPEFNGHYGRFMYWQGKPDVVKDTGWDESSSDVYDHHVAKYGHPSKFGYKDFIPMWKAEKFDAEKMADLFENIGARYIVPMAVHHDNFDNWDSKHHRWNSVNMGPKRDIIGEWEKACKSRGLRFGVSSHFNGGHENWFFQGGSDAKGPLKGIPYDTAIQQYEDFYHKRTLDRKKIVPEFAETFLKRHIDLVDSYKPDLLYFDGPLPYGDYGKKLAAHFYNQNMKDHKGNMEAVMTLKHDFPEEAATFDIEKGQADHLRKLPWQTDTSINLGWFYLGSKKSKVHLHSAEKANLSEEDIKSGLRMKAGLIIDNLVDIVSKNGNMLLNVGQNADGSISEVFVRELKLVGEWLKINGEAIYGTRPWIKFGEGPTKIKTGFDTEPSKEWSSMDIRFTTKGNVLYAIALDWPQGKSFTIKSLSDRQSQMGKIKSIQLIGFEKRLKWERDSEGLTIKLPKKQIGKYAFVFKIKNHD